MKKTILLAAIIAGIVLLATKKPGSDSSPPKPKTETKIYPGGAVSSRDTYPDGTIRCALKPPSERAVRTDCSEWR